MRSIKTSEAITVGIDISAFYMLKLHLDVVLLGRRSLAHV